MEKHWYQESIFVGMFWVWLR